MVPSRPASAWTAGHRSHLLQRAATQGAGRAAGSFAVGFRIRHQGNGGCQLRNAPVTRLPFEAFAQFEEDGRPQPVDGAVEPFTVIQLPTNEMGSGKVPGSGPQNRHRSDAGLVGGTERAVQGGRVAVESRR